MGDALFAPHNRLWHLVVLVGIGSGLLGAAFVWAMNRLTEIFGPEHWSDPNHLIVLVGAGVAVALLTKILGNPGDVELLVDNIHVGGRSDARQLRSLIPVSLIGISAGSAIGPEAPLVQSTGTVGDVIARRAGMSPHDARVLTITGMAAGFSVLFGAPLGSAVFALEILHRRGLQYYEALLPAGIGALAGYASYILVNGLGMDPIWQFPAVRDLRVVDLGVGAVAGVVGAIVAVAFTYLAHLMRGVLGRVPAGVRPPLGGLVLGALAFVSPYALTFGKHQIQILVDSKLTIGALLVAAGAKLLASSTIVSSGWRGGFIIPLFFIGAALGSVGAEWTGVDRVVAMTALMAAANVGVTKTPFGSALVVAEMAGMRLLPSTLLASVIALFLTSRVTMIETQRAREADFERVPKPAGVVTPPAPGALRHG